MLIYLRLVCFFVLIMTVVSCNNVTPSVTSTDANKSTNIVSHLKIIEIQLGNGKKAETMSQVAVHYTGWLYDEALDDKKGKMFDSSRELGNPLTFQLGKKRVIKGWDEGIVGMQLGGKRTLHIPSSMAYGKKRIGTPHATIPAHSALVFDVELIDLK